MWPPDMFGVAGSLLKISGAYIGAFRRGRGDKRWEDARLPGKVWRAKIDKLSTIGPSELRGALPAVISRAWASVIRYRATQISAIERPLADELIALALAADEASAEIGVSIAATPFLSAAQAILESNEFESYAWDIPRNTICLLGKRHTPQVGATFRSLTRHLALYLPNDISGKWFGPYERQATYRNSDSLNMLLLPWPTEIRSEDFKVSGRHRLNQLRTATYFEYSPAPQNLSAFRKRLSKAVTRAGKEARQIDAIIFPELALSEQEYYEAEQIAVRCHAVLIAGIRTPRRGETQGFNLCAMQPATLILRGLPSRNKRKGLKQKWMELSRRVQSKHHRWCLDEEQVLQYQLGGQLPTAERIWEDIDLPPRVMHFMTVSHWLTWSVLICEDLARQDPAADLIRAVGPNLLIALLMDGPQLRTRWPARYASVLAEDPGTSVLTLTSLGMAERSRPTLSETRRRADKSRTIALWRDIELGEQEITLDEGDDACLLSLRCKTAEETAADGSKAGRHFPVFAGFRSISTS